MNSKFWMAVLTAALLAACGKQADAPDAPDAPKAGTVGGAATATADGEFELPEGPWTELAHRLVESGTLDESVTVTREILARGGVATFDGERTLVEAVGPAATFTASPRETVHLAMEARRRAHAGRLTIAELAQMLETFGWPFPGSDPGDDAQRWDRVDSDAGDSAADDDAGIEALRTAASARDRRLVEQLREATAEWQRRRQAAAKASVERRAAAQEQVKQAWEARNALIAQRGEARLQADRDTDAARDRRVAERELRERTQAAQRLVGADYAAGEAMMGLLDGWVRAAAAAPDDPRSFTPLFLAEMARLQNAPVDLPGSRWHRPGRGKGPPVDLRGAPRSQQLRWTLLELELFGAAFDRGRDTRGASRMQPSGLRRAAVAFADAIVPPARAGNGCIDYKEAYGDTWGEVAGTAGGWGVGEALEGVIGEAADAGTAEGFGNAMNAIGIATKLAKLASFYADTQVYVEALPIALHKPTGSATKAAQFVARVGLDEKAMKEYERQLRETSAADRMARDCLESLGFPTSSDLADMTRDAENWLIDWSLTDGGGSHVMEAPMSINKRYLPGRRSMRLKRESATSLRSDFHIEVFPERVHQGEIVRAYATGEARVDAATMPSPGTFVTAAAGGLGLVEALVDLFGGWLQFVYMPKAYGTIEIEYHCPRPTRLHRPGSGIAVADGGGEEGPSKCVIPVDRRVNH